MDKTRLTDDADSQKFGFKDGHVRNVLIFVVFVMVICIGLVGYFIGGAVRTCTRTAENVDTDTFDFVELSQKNREPIDDNFVACMEMNMEPRPGDCVCTTSHGVALLQEAELSSGILAVLKKDQCLQLLRTLEWQTDGLVFYMLTSPENNQTGWAVSSYFRSSESCGFPPLLVANVESVSRYAGGMVSQPCLQCICQLESGCQPLGCRMDVGSLSCGYFQIKQGYWTDCGKPGKDLESCGKDIYCSSLCVQKYMARYVPGSGCTRTCETFAREHNGGPRGCRSASTLGYWRRLIRQHGCNNPPKFVENTLL